MEDVDENEYYDTIPFPEENIIKELVEIIYECKSLLDTKLDNYCSRRITHKNWFINTKQRCRMNNHVTLDKFINYYFGGSPLDKEKLKKLTECCHTFNDGYGVDTNKALLIKCLKDTQATQEKLILIILNSILKV